MAADSLCDHGPRDEPGQLVTPIHVGQHVRALSSWEGYVAEISDEEACGQGRLVTCHPITLPATPERDVFGAPGRPWKPITVTEGELTPTGKLDLIPQALADEFGGSA